MGGRQRAGRPTEKRRYGTLTNLKLQPFIPLIQVACLRGTSISNFPPTAASYQPWPSDLHIDIKQDRFTDALDFRDDTFQIEGLCEYDLEYLLYIDRGLSRTEDEGGMHSFGKAFRLWVQILATRPRACLQPLTCFVISSCSSLGNVAKVSYLVPIRNGMAVYGEE